MSTHKKSSNPVALATYTPEEYRKILDIVEDPQEMLPTWEEWHQNITERKREFAALGIETVDTPIDANGLVKYCLEHGEPINENARAGYALWLHQQQAAPQITPASLADIDDDEEERPGVDTSSYTEPVSKLFSQKAVEPGKPFPEVDYVHDLGIGPQDIPELIRMATDPQLSSEEANDTQYTATLHAVKTLAQLHAEAAIEPLAPLFEIATKNNNEWLYDTVLPDFYAEIGTAAVPTLTKLLATPTVKEDEDEEDFTRMFVSNAFVQLAKKHPEARDICVQAITHTLEDYQKNDSGLNAGLVANLIELKAVESAPIIEQAYTANRVDPSFCGDWDEVQYDLGLKERPPEKERKIKSFDDLFSSPPPSASVPATSIAPLKSSKKPKGGDPKTKQKMAKASKKKNRRK